ncbi:MAG: DUF916 domain-containing protein, partial [Chloroflexi bacterium]|nr:DUF916 domain-containing protein [Chloroflexota bacterium]
MIVRTRRPLALNLLRRATSVVFGAGLLAAAAAAPALAQSSPAAAGSGSFTVRPTPDADLNNPKDAARDHGATSRSWFTLHASAGDTINDSVQIANTGSVAVDVLVYGVDATTGATTGMVMQSQDAPKNGVGAWVTTSLPEAKLQPGETKDIPFTVKVPTNAAAGEHWGGLIAQDTNVRAGSGQFAVSQVMRSGIALGVVVPGQAVQKLSVTGVTEKVINDLNEVFVIDIANQGTTMVKPQGQLVIKDGSGKQVASRDLKLDNILAGDTVPYEFIWPTDSQLPTGKYSASVSLTYADGAQPATFNQDALQVQAPGSQLVDASSPSAAAAPLTKIVPTNSPAPSVAPQVVVAAPAPAIAAAASPLQTLLPALGGAAVVAV